MCAVRYTFVLCTSPQVAKCRVAASAPRGGANNVASGKAGRAATTRGMRICFNRAPRSGAFRHDFVGNAAEKARGHERVSVDSLDSAMCAV
jgi:hypothetical protein